MSYPTDDDIREWFKDHRAKQTVYTAEDGHTITAVVWSAPGTWMYGINYLLSGNCLTVSGDCGEAIYGWGMPNLTGGKTFLQWIAGLDIGYFASKCMASAVGRLAKEYSAEDTIKRFEEEMAHYDDAEAVKARAVEHDYKDGAQTEFEWQLWLMDHADYVLGHNDWCHSVETCHAVTISCRQHLIGVKMASEQIGADTIKPGDQVGPGAVAAAAPDAPPAVEVDVGTEDRA